MVVAYDQWTGQSLLCIVPRGGNGGGLSAKRSLPDDAHTPHVQRKNDSGAANVATEAAGAAPAKRQRTAAPQVATQPVKHPRHIM